MTIYFTSDQHFSHTNVIKYCNRPYPDVHSMNKDMVERYNAIVQAEDTVYMLGDFALDERVVPKILPMLKGHKHLIVGNHDRCHPRRSRHATFKQRYLNWGFETINIEATLEEFTLSHFPYGGEDSGHEARYPEWRPKDEGKNLLCGHIHEKWKIKDRMYNVGVDVNNFTPVSLDQIRCQLK